MPLSRLFCTLKRALFPEPLQRPAEQQAAVDSACEGLALYHYLGCPYCMKVKRRIRQLNLPIESRDVNGDARWRNELVGGGGRMQVPCLRIASSDEVEWLYESNDINAYLQRRFGADA